ncbi:MAG TPA: Lrp/AsnC family transcriptional regulator [Ktedonobacterales bacterium]|nr:Lrp/AsnC family transcriptional regulator [Ktedonobacterales bacterium]
MIDDVDAKILTILQQDARASSAEIARQIGMAPSAIHERMRKLEARGVVEGYEARINADALGLGLTAFVFVRANERVGQDQAGEQLAALPEVQEVHHVAGEDCYLVKVRVADTHALSRLLREGFSSVDAVTSTRSTIVLSTLKETANLPIRATNEADHD